MEPKFITYQRFDDIELARETTLVLDIHGLEYQIEDIFPSYAVNVKLEDLERVKQVLGDDDVGSTDEDDDGSGEPEGIGEDYYLFAFTNDELLEVIANADEWNDTDVSLARKILIDKGVAMNEVQLKHMHELHEAELHQPIKTQTASIVFGYMMALLGGIVGIAIGLDLNNSEKTLPNGEKIYKYTDADRRHGRRMCYLGLIIAVTLIVWCLNRW